MNNNQAVAILGKIIELSPIIGADNIVSATVICGKHGKWRGVVNKRDFKVDDFCEVYLQDCLLPKDNERFSFMSKHHWRIKMCRFKGSPSEVLIMPNNYSSFAKDFYEIGFDIGTHYGCSKYEKPMPASLQGLALGDFPSFIPKTDEPNFQKVPHLIEALIGNPYYITETADGSSATIYKHNDHFGCCSRNLELKETENNSIWKIARKYNLEKLLPNDIAIQFEVVGEGVQGNPMGIKGIEPRLFNAYDINDQEYFSMTGLANIANEVLEGFPLIKLVDSGDNFHELEQDKLLRLAEGLYANGKQREGIVIRSKDALRVNGERLSFKVINLNYKN